MEPSVLPVVCTRPPLRAVVSASLRRCAHAHCAPAYEHRERLAPWPCASLPRFSIVAATLSSPWKHAPDEGGNQHAIREAGSHLFGSTLLMREAISMQLGRLALISPWKHAPDEDVWEALRLALRCSVALRGDHGSNLGPISAHRTTAHHTCPSATKASSSHCRPSALACRTRSIAQRAASRCLAAPVTRRACCTWNSEVGRRDEHLHSTYMQGRSSVAISNQLLHTWNSLPWAYARVARHSCSRCWRGWAPW